MENPKLKILNLKAQFIADHLRKMVDDMTVEADDCLPVANDIFMDAAENVIRLALFELGV